MIVLASHVLISSVASVGVGFEGALDIELPLTLTVVMPSKYAAAQYRKRWAGTRILLASSSSSLSVEGEEGGIVIFRRGGGTGGVDKFLRRTVERRGQTGLYPDSRIHITLANSRG